MRIYSILWYILLTIIILIYDHSVFLKLQLAHIDLKIILLFKYYVTTLNLFIYLFFSFFFSYGTLFFELLCVSARAYEINPESILLSDTFIWPSLRGLLGIACNQQTRLMRPSNMISSEWLHSIWLIKK